MEEANEAAILERRHEIRASLRSLENNLRDVGAVADGYASAYYLESDSDQNIAKSNLLFQRKAERVSDAALARARAIRFDFDPPDEVRYSWKISPLGEVKCREIWRVFDADEDDCWVYNEFLEYLTATKSMGMSDELMAFEASEEIWRMTMSDLCELDEEGRLTFDGFVMHREMIEDVRPLAADLKVLRISLQWEELEKMKTVKRVFKEYVDDPAGGVTAKSMQYLLAELGVVMTSEEVTHIIERRYRHARCMKAIRQLKRTLRLFGYHQKSALKFVNDGVSRGSISDEQPRMCEVGLLSLLFSAWSPLVITHWRKFFLMCRLLSFSALRRLQSRMRWAFNYVRQAATTGLLSATCLQSRIPGQDRADYLLRLDVGPQFSTNASIHVTYNSDADSAATLHELKYLERGAECFAYIDITCRAGTKDNDAQLIVDRLTWFIGEYFHDHIESLPFFHRWFVTLPTKPQLRLGPASSGGGGSIPTVVRLVILFTGELDLYQVMQSLNLPSSMQFDHLLRRFSMRWLCSHSLEELLVTKKLNLGSQWCCRTQMDVRLNRQAWAQILAQIAHQLDAEEMHEREVAEYIAQAKAERDRKKKRSTVGSLSNHPNNQDDPTRSTIELEEISAGHRISLITWLRRAAHFLAHSQQLSSTWLFTSLHEAFEDNLWIRSVLSPQWFVFLQHVLETPGGLAAEWKLAGESLRAEFADSNFARTANRTPFAQRLSSPSIGIPPTSRSIETAKQPARQDSVETKTSAPEPIEEKSVEDSLLEFYEFCARNLQGIHVLRAEAGTSGVTCVLEGWNFFSLLPRIHRANLASRASLLRVGTFSRRQSNSSRDLFPGAGL